MPTTAQYLQAYHTPWPQEAKRLMRRAQEFRGIGDHMAAGLLEKDAAALDAICADDS